MIPYLHQLSTTTCDLRKFRLVVKELIGKTLGDSRSLRNTAKLNEAWPKVLAPPKDNARLRDALW
jgi:hypothetical protein